MEKRTLIGFLTNDLVGAYQYAFWSGMNAAARVEKCDLVSFNGGEIGSKDPIKAMRRSAFDIVKQAKPDAVVVLAPVLANFNGPEAVREFIGALAPIPVVTVGFGLSGHPSIVVDSSKGIDLLVEHIVTTHGRSRIAFIGGPALNPEAKERKEAFQASLKRLKLGCDPALELIGEFDFGIARERLGALLDAGVVIDAVIAANDNMALGAMEALKDRGRKIPDDVIVAGFDDIEDGQFSTPALTTIRQPVFEQGESSLRLALDLIDGLKVPETTRQEALLVRRGSCGCRSHALEEARSGLFIANLAGGTPKSLGSPAHKEAVRNACETLGDQRLPDSLETFVGAVCREAVQGGADESLGAFQFLVDIASRPDDSPERWQVFLSRFRGATLPFLPPDPRTLVAFDGLLHQMRVAAHERAVQIVSYRSLDMQRWSRKLHETGTRLVDSFDLDKLVETLANDLKGLQISSFHLLLRGPFVKDASMRLHLSVDNGVRASIPLSGQLTTVGDLFQRIVRDSPVRRAILVEPLFFGTAQLGFAFLELSTRRGMLLDSLRGQISASIMGARYAAASSVDEPKHLDPDRLIGW